MKIFLIVVTILPLLLFSNPIEECKIGSSIMPQWVCHPETTQKNSLVGLGIGSSYKQAILFALCELSTQFSSKSISSKKDARDTSTQKSECYLNEDVFVSSTLKDYKYPSKKNPDNRVLNFNCKVAIQKQDRRLFLQETIKESKKGIETSSKYNIPQDTNLEELLKTKGIIIIHKVSKNNNFYVVLEVNKTQLKEK